jgi:hypothetical protein
MGDYCLILMKIGTLINKNMPTSEITEAEVDINFQDGCRRHVGISGACYKMGNYHPI